MDDLNLKDILVRKPYYYILPTGYLAHKEVTENNEISEPSDRLRMQIVTQADFLRQYYPSSHLINDREAFPDIMKKDPETGKWYIQPVTRYAFAFQQVIAVKQVVHIIGNDVQFELADGGNPEEKEEKNEKLLIDFKKTWLEMGMEVKVYESIRSVKITGDGAIVAYFDKDGNPCARVLSYLNGDKLYPHYDSITGELNLFARKYYDLDEDGSAVTEWVEIWDEKYLRRFKKDVTKGAIIKMKEFFGLNGYKEEGAPQKHGFDFVPVAYYRDKDGACWLNSQSVIEAYEESFSYLAESNKAFALPIMYFKGDGIDIHGDMNGAVKSVSMPEDAEAGFLNRQDVSSAYNTQLNTLYKLIYELSFAVQPPELKSGDLPGVALKLLYSPAIEKAIHDCQCLQPYLNTLVRITKACCGRAHNNTATMANLGINAWLEPYVHQNDTELVTNLASAVQNEFLSRRTASERCPKFPKNDEYERIIRERKEKEQADLLMELREQEHQTDEEIRKQKEMNQLTDGSDVNTGNGKGGRPNKSGKKWDKNGNNPIDDANNWDTWNKKH